MNFRGHVLTGIATAGIIGYSAVKYNLSSLEELKIIIPAIVLGANWPDIDCKSTPSKLYAIALLIFSIYWYITGQYLYIMLGIVPYLIAKIDKHRGITHWKSLPFVLFFTASILQYITYIMPVGLPKDFIKTANLAIKYELHIEAFSVGILCHDLVDMVSTYFKRRRK